MMSTIQERRVLESLKNLGMHETMTIDSQTEVRRVPGGFLYVTTIRNGTMVGMGPTLQGVASTFVSSAALTDR